MRRVLRGWTWHMGRPRIVFVGLGFLAVGTIAGSIVGNGDASTTESMAGTGIFIICWLVGIAALFEARRRERSDRKSAELQNEDLNGH